MFSCCKKALLGSLGLLLAVIVHASTPEEAVRPIQDQWAEIKYRTPEKQQADQYQTLGQTSRQLVESPPGMAEALIGEGIVVYILYKRLRKETLR